MAYKYLTEYPSGFFLLKKFFNQEEATCLRDRVLDAQGEAPFHRYVTQSGKEFNASMMNFGQYGWWSDTQGYRYTAINPATEKPWPEMPTLVHYLTLEALKRTCGIPDGYDPQSCLVNFYGGTTGKLGSHIDNTESVAMPIVSLSVGAPAVFGIPGGNVLLEEGDVCVMSGESRFIKHAVKTLLPTSSTVLAGGRLCFTIRQAFPLEGEPQSFRHLK